MEYNYFPITLAQLAATIRFHDIAEGEFAIGEMRVTAKYLNHPVLTLAIACRPAAMWLCTRWITSRMPRTRRQEPRVSHRGTRRTSVTSISWRTRTSSFTILSTRLQSIRRRRAGGHTPAEWAVDYAVAARAKRLALTHHDPLRDDETVDRVVEMCRRRASAAGSRLEVFAAAEGQELRFIERDAKTPAAARAPEPARKVGPRTILVADDDPTIVRLLTLALEQDGFRVVTASDGEAALRLTRLERPDLILLDWQMPSADGMRSPTSQRARSCAARRARRADYGTVRAREHGGGICRRRDRLSDQTLPARACSGARLSVAAAPPG